MIFAVWAVLLGGQFVRHLDAAGDGWAIAPVGSPPPKSPDPSPNTCKDVKAEESRTVVMLSDGLEVLCDTDTDGGGWLVFQRRVRGDVDFFRGWTEYKYGFGELKGDFWLGNENIHRLTFLRRYMLRIEFTFMGVSLYAEYSKFRIFGEAENYRLEVEGHRGSDANDFGYHNGRDFSTKDRDNDADPYTNCAAHHRGAWWYSACVRACLNGMWLSKSDMRGLVWLSVTGYHDTATSSEMKMRALD